jgi:hypothetical protein
MSGHEAIAQGAALFANVSQWESSRLAPNDAIPMPSSRRRRLQGFRRLPWGLVRKRDNATLRNRDSETPSSRPQANLAVLALTDRISPLVDGSFGVAQAFFPPPREGG